ncbi:MAG TPA: DNA-binding domain-containing protein [Rhodanobacteraceae bacterium]
MHALPSLLECQRQFLAALYDDHAGAAAPTIAGNGLTPEARLRIYRHSSEETHSAALRTTYPAVRALVGGAFFDQTARGYRRAHPSTSGNLQEFGATFAEYLETLRACRSLAYLPDVARLEWLRQQAVLAPDSQGVPPDALTNDFDPANRALRIVLHPSVHLLASRHEVLTIWRYAIGPATERHALDGDGERVALWREDGEVAMAALDAASFACIEALARGSPLEDADAVASAIDPDFALPECIESLLQHRLVVGLRPRGLCGEVPPCR